MRYAIERKRNKRTKKFDLDSDDDDMQNIQLTHKGKHLYELNDRNYDKPQDRPSESEDDDKYLDDNIVERLHFGGKDVEKEDDELFTVKKTKEEVFREIVAKSKLYKAAKAELKDQNEEMIDQLDEEFADIFPLLDTRKKAKKEIEESTSNLLPNNVSLLEVAKKQNDKEIRKKAEMRKRDQKQVRKTAPETTYDYDFLAVDLKSCKKARPHSLVKSEKERALDRKEELEQLEKQIQHNDKVITDQLDNYSGDEVSESSEEPDQDKNDALVDLIEREYNEDDEEPDEFEAIDEDSDE